MKHRRRLFLGLGLVMLAVGGVVCLAWQESQVDLIEIGMTRAQVEAILGPTDNYSPILAVAGPPGVVPPIADVPQWSASWQTGTAFIDVMFDASGRVSHKFMRNDPLLNRIRRWLGL
jgi:hypothetical protein